MKMYLRIVCATLVAVFLFSCKKHSDKPPQLTVDRSAISLGVFQGYTDSFEVQSGIDWQLQLSPASAAQWMQVSATQGNAGKTIVKLSTIAVNTTTQTATISISPAGSTTPKVDVTVTQKIYVADWNKIAGGNDRDEVKSMARTADGGFVIVGQTVSDGRGDLPASRGDYDGFIMKVNATGAIIWSKTLGGDAPDRLNSVAVAPDGSLVACGVSVSDNNGDIPAGKGYYDMWVVKLDANGTKLWSKVYGGSVYDEGKSVLVAPGGNLFVLGDTYSENSGDVGPNNGGSDMWVLKLDPSGNILWNKMFGGNDSELTKRVVITADGSIVASASTYSNNNGDVGPAHGELDTWVLKLDASGNIVWNRIFGGSEHDELYSIALTPDNGFVLAGYSESHNSGDISENKGVGDAWVLKIDAAGNKVWSRTYGGDSWDELLEVAVNPEGELLLSGYSASYDNGDVGHNNGAGDMWLLKLNGMGNKLWSKAMGGDEYDFGASVLPLSNGEFIVGGSTASNGTGDVGATHGDYDIWLVKFK